MALRSRAGYRYGMSQVKVLLSEDLVKAAHLESGEVSLEAAKLIALELFREQKVSIGRAAELCGVPLATFMDFAAAHEVPPLNYDHADLKHDRRTLAKLRA
jgi:predicted HTH domain antitoxin